MNDSACEQFTCEAKFSFNKHLSQIRHQHNTFSPSFYDNTNPQIPKTIIAPLGPVFLISLFTWFSKHFVPMLTCFQQLAILISVSSPYAAIISHALASWYLTLLPLFNFIILTESDCIVLPIPRVHTVGKCSFPFFFFLSWLSG